MTAAGQGPPPSLSAFNGGQSERPLIARTPLRGPCTHLPYLQGVGGDKEPPVSWDRRTGGKEGQTEAKQEAKQQAAGHFLGTATKARDRGEDPQDWAGAACSHRTPGLCLSSVTTNPEGATCRLPVTRQPPQGNSAILPPQAQRATRKPEWPGMEPRRQHTTSPNIAGKWKNRGQEGCCWKQEVRICIFGRQS